MTPAVRARDGAAGESFLHGRNPLIAIVRFTAGGALADVVRALAAGGIELTEITIDTPGALAAVEAAVAEGHTVGVGTVVTAEQVRASARAGASFVVSPGLVADVVQEARACGIEPIPGVFTGTEVLAAMSAGARLLKLFPAAPVGTRYLQALRAPFPTQRSSPPAGSRSPRSEGISMRERSPLRWEASSSAGRVRAQQKGWSSSRSGQRSRLGTPVSTCPPSRVRRRCDPSMPPRIPPRSSVDQLVQRRGARGSPCRHTRLPRAHPLQQRRRGTDAGACPRGRPGALTSGS